MKAPKQTELQEQTTRDYHAAEQRAGFAPTNTENQFVGSTVDGRPVTIIRALAPGDAGYSPDSVVMLVKYEGDDKEYAVARSSIKGPGAPAPDLTVEQASAKAEADAKAAPAPTA